MKFLCDISIPSNIVNINVNNNDTFVKNQECLSLGSIATIRENINGVITTRIGKFLIK